MRPRRAPNPGQLYEITTRVRDRLMLLRPSKQVNDIIVGVIGRAQHELEVDMQLHAFVFMSTHYHMLATFGSAKDQSKFVGFINGNITRSLNELNERRGGAWDGPFKSIPVSQDRPTQEYRLRYILAHGVKEKLVRRAQDWPGASSLPWLLREEAICGTWTDLTASDRAERRKGHVPTPGEFDTEYELQMTTLPCWQALPPEEWRGLVAETVEEIEAEAEAERVALGVEVLGVEAVLAADPYAKIPKQRRSRAPSVHALDKAVRKLLTEGLRALNMAYTEASRRFRAGEWDVVFPAGMFRPLGGFVAQAA